MKAGEINKGAVALLLVLVIGAAGYLWYKQLYTPAVAERTTAKSAAETAQQGLQTAEAELVKAQAAVEKQKSVASKPDNAVSRLQLAAQAVPNKPLIDEAALQLKHLADRSGISTSINVGGEANAAVAGAGGSTPIDITFTAAGTYAEMQGFMDQVQGTVTLDDGKLHARGRLFNVVSLTLGAPDKDSGDQQQANPAAGGGGTESAGADDLEIGPFDIQFTVVVRAYASTTENATSAGAALTPDPAAANAAAAGAATPAADGTSTATTDSPTTGGAAVDPNAAGGTAGGGIPSSTAPTTPAGGQ